MTKEFEMEEEQEQLDFVQPHKKIKVNLVPCEDAISRQAAIDAIENTKSAKSEDGEIYVAKINAEMNIQQLPSVSMEKTGHWIMTSDYLTAAYGSIDYVKCSRCQEYSLEEGNYCPNCGAKMIEPKEV